MGIIKDYTSLVKQGAKSMAGGIREGTKRAAVMNRLRTVIRCQERAAEKEYLALGRYYYNALRDKNNELAEGHCTRIDEIQQQLDSALSLLQKEAAAEAENAKKKHEACSVGVICGADDPAAPTKKDKRDGTLFHFDKGPIEITITRDSTFDPNDENSEEIDLSDVQSFDYDPTAPSPASPEKKEAETPASGMEESSVEEKPQSDVSNPKSDAAEPKLSGAEPKLGGADLKLSGAELDENDGLPFEG